MQIYYLQINRDQSRQTRASEFNQIAKTSDNSVSSNASANRIASVKANSLAREKSMYELLLSYFETFKQYKVYRNINNSADIIN